MDLRDYLTTEELRKKFKSQFDLVSHAIAVAENMILSGRGPRIKNDIQNRSLQILTEIANGKDQLDDLPEAPVVEVRQESIVVEAKSLNQAEGKKSSRNSLSKISSPKKGRKILSDSPR